MIFTLYQQVWPYLICGLRSIGLSSMGCEPYAHPGAVMWDSSFHIYIYQDLTQVSGLSQDTYSPDYPFTTESEPIWQLHLGAGLCHPTKPYYTHLQQLDDSFQDTSLGDIMPHTSTPRWKSCTMSTHWRQSVKARQDRHASSNTSRHG